MSVKYYIPTLEVFTLEVLLLFETEAVIRAIFSIEVRSFEASAERDFLIQERTINVNDKG